MMFINDVIFLFMSVILSKVYRKNKAMSHKTSLKKLYNTPDSSRNLLIKRQISYLDSYTQNKKQLLWQLQVWKKQSQQYFKWVGGWVVYGTHSQRIMYLFDCIEQLFFNGLFQKNYFKNHIFQEIKLKYTFSSACFLWKPFVTNF